MLNRILAVCILLVLLVSCGPAAETAAPAVRIPTSSATTSQQETGIPTEGPASLEEKSPEPEAGQLEQEAFSDFPGAGAIDFTFDDAGSLYLAYSQDSNVWVTQSKDGGESFGAPVSATTIENVFVYPLERPAIQVGPDGRILVAWPENSYPGRIWHSFSDDGGLSFSESEPLSEQGQETVLVRMLAPAGKQPIAVWLQMAQLHFARSEDGGAIFQPDVVVDDQTCDCCHPQPLWVGEDLYIAFRNLEIDEQGRNIRDIFVVRSTDGGETFNEPVRVSDAPWYIAACPFSGPSMITDSAGNLYVSWMDGRNDARGDLSWTDIWLAISTDGGRTFSENRRINQTDGVYTNLPSLALDGDGRLHAIWQASEGDRDVLIYAFSEDGGETFAPPQVLVDSGEAGNGPPTNATLLVGTDGTIFISWVDRSGAYLASWR